MPLWYIWPSAFQSLVRVCKSLFAMLLVHMFYIFAYSEIVLSFGDLDGNLVDATQFAKINSHGRVVGLNLPATGIWMGNHQIYTDWVYMCRALSVYADLEANFYIVMKDSLRRIPILGYYMGLLQFFFLSRNWEKDQARLKTTLQSILETGPSKLALLLYPEGTNISRNTIRKSHNYSASHNKPMLQNVLLPHSTGLYFCTKTIQSKLPNTYILVRRIA
ncbi:hypothetical protein MYAM1_002285 [Malassezia yamatoensis]|uniref:Phospholipid/glycerol acyltransferase domain-containing protein n=1 Tax=Malassezia yamatoensis TaxID=253288 RepID=A0AAJ5YST6_9BASI|nr:hypothetical protein MYAM1_002285 [Malassezia yamatoensis]